MNEDLVEAWLADKPSATQRSYRSSINLFKKDMCVSILDATKKNIILWKTHMIKNKKSNNTINSRISALSSFYSFCIRIDELENNPANIKRMKTIDYKNSVSLSKDQVSSFLNCIKKRRDDPNNTLNKTHGSQDYALFLGYILLGLRNHAWRRANIKDFIGYENESCFYKWVSKGKTGKCFVSKHLLDSIKHCENMGLVKNGFIFAPLGDSCYNFLHVDKKNPYISGEEINRRLHIYAKMANCDIDGLVIHSLRHTAATLRRSIGADIEEIKEFMNHSSAEVTDRYLHQIEGVKDNRIDDVYDLIDF